MNTRDLGGLPTHDGHRTRWRSVVRSDNPARLTKSGWAALSSYGVRTVVALRTAGRSDQEPDRALMPPELKWVEVEVEDATDPRFERRWVSTGLWGTPLYFADALERWPDKAARAIAEVAWAGPGGIVVACGRGCDRTGFVTMLLLHLVGVPAEEIAADYECSASQLAEQEPGFERQLHHMLAAHHTSVLETVRSTLVRVADRLRRAGLTDQDAARLRSRLVES